MLETVDLNYQEFLKSKERRFTGYGINSFYDNPFLYPFQNALTRWAVKKGRACIFADTGLGKTRMQIAWAQAIGKRTLIFSPLCVTEQTRAEAKKMSVIVGDLGSNEQIVSTNYENIHHVNPSEFEAVILDESSILKSFDGKTKARLIDMFQDTPFKLCCTATPSPNDIVEIANHCEFMGIMKRTEMLATFFVHDDNGYRLKRHAIDPFYRWLATWGIFIKHPSDLGFDQAGYDLPEMNLNEHVVESNLFTGFIIPSMGIKGIQGRLMARRHSLEARVDKAIQIIKSFDDKPCIVWCGLNDEQDAIAKTIGEDCVSVFGSQTKTEKEELIHRFLSREKRVLVTKPKIAGWGLNLQFCNNMVFLGIGDSWETYYQCIRRCWRFGQTKPVNVHIVVSDAELGVVDNVKRKDNAMKETTDIMISIMKEVEMEEVFGTKRESEKLQVVHEKGKDWHLINGDCVDEMKNFSDSSMDVSIYSPPFLSLYTYTNSERDMGNCSSKEQFIEHFGFAVKEILRITKPGRLTCVHVSNVASTKQAHGVIGLIDFRGAVVELYVKNGWIFHGEITIDKDPQAQAIRTKSKALLFVQLHKDSSWLRPALCDYILLFRKPGENQSPIIPDITNDQWVEWARPVWYGIQETNTLNVHEASGKDDERHICPLQLDVIERCIKLWSNPGETVFSPFAGIGSEGYQAIKLGRKFVGIELKREYFNTAKKNLSNAERSLGIEQLRIE